MSCAPHSQASWFKPLPCLRLPRPDEAAAQTLATGLARIRITAADLIKLSGDLLDLAQVEVGSPALAPVLVDLRTLLAQLLPDTRQGSLQLPPRLPLISADLACLRQGFDALLDHIRRLDAAAPAAAPCLAAGAAVDLPFVHVWLRTGSAGTSTLGRGWPPGLGVGTGAHPRPAFFCARRRVAGR